MGFDKTKPLGGSEMGLLLLADALKEAGFSVSFDLCEARALIVSRYSDVPKVKADRTVIYAADIYDHRYDKHLGLPIQCVSHFQANWFRMLGHKATVIRPILGRHVKHAPLVFNRWIYPCAVGKGLHETLKAWSEVADGRTLVVTTSGYDKPDEQMCRDYGAIYIGQFTPEGLAHQIAISEGMFYRNVAPECFPMTVAIAAHCGLELDIECVGHSHCGIQEAMKRLDLRPEVIVQDWIEFLGLR